MPGPSRPCHVFRFEGLEVDLRAGELRKQGEKIKLQEQPLQILRMLLERPGEIVTREEIQQKLWPTDTFVEFDHSINAAIQRLRQALGDSAENPRFVETMARRGYRFIAPVDVGAIHELPLSKIGPRAIHESPLRRWWPVIAGGLVALAAVLLALNVAGLRDRVLRAVGAVREPPLQIHSLAVLPLENLSGDPEQEYFADGMTDALITELGQIRALRVISRTSVMQYKEKRKPLPEIARELNVDAVVEGSVLRSENRVRIAANLLHAPTDRHLWAKSYERDLRDVLSLQGEIARTIAGEVKAKVTPDVQARLARARPVNPEAFDLYLRGLQAERQGTRESFKSAVDHFQRAIEQDPAFGLAYAALAQMYWWHLPFFAAISRQEGVAKARKLVQKALEIDENLAEGHLEQARILHFYDWDWANAEREYMRAIELNPNLPRARTNYSMHLLQVGQTVEGMNELTRVREIDPRSALDSYVGFQYWVARRYDQAIEHARRALELNPNDRTARGTLGLAYAGKGMYEQAMAEFQKADPNDLGARAHLGHAFAAAGRRAEALRSIDWLKDHARPVDVVAYGIGFIYAELGEKDLAFQFLNKAFELHDVGMTYLKTDPCLDKIRSAPRFQDLLRRMNFPP